MAAALAALLLALASAAPGAGTPPETDAPAVAPAPGRTLVATRRIRGNLFQRSVVFLIEYGAGGAMGVIVNRPTDRALEELFPGTPARAGPVFLGGPVDRQHMIALLRSSGTPERSKPVAGDVHLTSDESTLRAAAAAPDAARRLRVFAGYAGWLPGQLENEIERGDWLVVDLPPGDFFEAPTGPLWERLFERHRRLVASLDVRAGARLPPLRPSITVGAMSHEVEHRTLARYLEDNHLKHTKQREAILEVFLDATGHITAEDLYQRVSEEHPQIGYTTVYRTMKLLCEAGLAQEHNFDGVARYEIAHEHHDHLVCTRCGRIVEFECEMIESAQEKIAERYGFRVLRHRHELYGHCASCQRERAKA